jgi:fatty-acid peroxygenase
MSTIPRDPALDGAIALLREGYLYLPRRFEQLGSDVIAIRLAGVPFLALRGREGARLFYDRSRFARADAVPEPVRHTLIGDGAVQTLDDESHTHRKAMFVALMGRDRIDALMERLWREWYAALDRSGGHGRMELFREAQEVLCRAVCGWAGVPLAESEVRRRASDLAAMVEGFGSIGRRHLRGRIGRLRAETWIGGIVEAIRTGVLRVPERSAAHVIATHRDEHGALLDRRTAAVELLNVLRPTVAIATYVAFVAHALHTHPAERARLREGSEEELEAFVHEVRRFYPFTPFLGARVRASFEWQGHAFPAEHRVLLDVYGTSHDARIWPEPEVFRPDRFRGWTGDPFGFLPQGGGDHAMHHRCAGEWITIEAMKLTTAFLTRAVDFRVPPQDERIDLGRIPTRPRSGMILEGVRVVRAEPARPTVTRPGAPAHP